MTRCPWHVSAHAVRRYLALLGRPDTEAEFQRGEDELRAMAAKVVEAVELGAKRAQEVRPGLLHYRGPRPLRLGLRVSTEGRADGSLPQLVDVTPSHAGGVGAGLATGDTRRRERYEEAEARAVASRAAEERRRVDAQDVVVALHLAPEAHATAKRLAAREDIPLAKWLRRIIEEYVRRTRA